MSDWTTTVAGVTPAPMDPAPGRARLARVIEIAETVPDGNVAVRAISELLTDEDAIRELVMTWRADRAGLTGQLMRLGAVKGLRPRVTALEKVIVEAGDRQARIEADARYQLALGQASVGTVAQDLARCLGRHPLPPGLGCPPGWELTPEGLYRLRVNEESEDTEQVEVSHRPIIVEGRLRDVEDDSVYLVLGWSTAFAGWRTTAVPRFKVADSRQIVTLADLDLPVNSNNAGQVVSYLSDFEAVNTRQIPESGVTTRMGWQGTDEDLYFLWGRTVLRPAGLDCGPPSDERTPAHWKAGQVQLLTSDPGSRAVSLGFRSAGTWEGWCEAVRAALQFPRALLPLYAALVPPLMRFMPALANFILDLSGETSLGKTTALRLAASVWGSPNERGGGIIYAWDASRVFVERSGAMLDYLPMFLDDTKRARRPEDVGKTLYDYASGIGRARGALQGLQRVTQAHGVLLSTGEAPATSFTNDGGTRARTLCLWGSPFEGASRATEAAVARIQSAVLSHHGHAGPRLVRYLLDNPCARAGLATELARNMETWTQFANGHPVAGRAAQYVAAMAVAKRLFHEVLGLPEPVRDPLVDAWEAVRAGSMDSDRPTEALRAVLSWAASQQHRFYGRMEHEPGNDPVPSAGWIGAWHQRTDWKTLAILPSELKGFLEKQGFEQEPILRSWRDRGWLLTEEEHLTRKVTIGHRKARCFVLKRECVDQVSGLE